MSPEPCNAFLNPLRRPLDPEVPGGLMLLGLSALLSGTALLLHSASAAFGGAAPVALLTGVLAALLMVAGCRLWHRCTWALDFLLLGWIGSFVLLTVSWSPESILASAALAMPWGVAGAIWIAGIAYLIRWRMRWRAQRERETRSGASEHASSDPH